MHSRVLFHNAIGRSPFWTASSRVAFGFAGSRFLLHHLEGWAWSFRLLVCRANFRFASSKFLDWGFGLALNQD